METLNLYRATQSIEKYLTQYPQFVEIALQPAAVWLGDWSGNVSAAVTKFADDAKGKTLLLVSYNIPNRDNGNYSAGGKKGPDDYYAWIGAIGAAIGNAPAIVILEPDAMGLLHGMQEPAKGERLAMLSTACDILKKQPNAKVYIDLSMWITPDLTAQSLAWSNIGKKVDGFSCNVSGYKPLGEVYEWAEQVAKLTGLKYVVDTSRNGVGTAGAEWCNPTGQGLGMIPQYVQGVGNMLAALWIKAPGESDGTCNGGPAAGEVYVDRAIELIKNRIISKPTTMPENTDQSQISLQLADHEARIAKLEKNQNPASIQPAVPAVVQSTNSVEGLLIVIGNIRGIIQQGGDEHKQVQAILDLIRKI